MNPEEQSYTTEAYQINVAKVYEKLNNAFASKPSLLKSKKARNLKANINLSFELFREKKGIQDDYSHYNVNCHSLIDSSHEDWFTWFAYQILVLPISQITLYLEHHLNNAANKDEFLLLIENQTMRFLSPIDVSYFQSRINYVSIWVTKHTYDIQKKEDQQNNYAYERISNLPDEQIVQTYFHQLSVNDFMTKEDVNHLIKANFDFGEAVPMKKFNITIDKSHLNFFVRHFFKKYIFSQVNIGMAVSQFLRNNFTLYNEESMNSKKESNLRKSFRTTPPKRYPFELI